jgi:hypothetical protein
MEDSMESKPYKTSDTPYAAFLHYHKHQFVTVRKDPNDIKRKVYVFIEIETTKDLEKEYYNGEPNVIAPLYYKSVRLMFAKLRDFK